VNILTWLRQHASNRTITLTSATLSGLIGGVAFGAMVSPLGIAVGLLVGTALGLLAGNVMAMEDERADAHTRELDAITVDKGTISVPLKMPKGRLSEADDFDDDDDDDWASDWLTPPPPPARR
jgi:hypothetical protein